MIDEYQFTRDDLNAHARGVAREAVATALERKAREFRRLASEQDLKAKDKLAESVRYEGLRASRERIEELESSLLSAYTLHLGVREAFNSAAESCERDATVIRDKQAAEAAEFSRKVAEVTERANALATV